MIPSIFGSTAFGYVATFLMFASWFALVGWWAAILGVVLDGGIRW